MKCELRPGGLAVVIKSRSGHNLGKLVELCDLVHPGCRSKVSGGWLRDDAPSCAWCVKGNDLLAESVDGRAIVNQNHAFFSPCALMPINDPGETQETETTKKTGIPA